MGGRQGTTGQRLELALIRDVLAEGLISVQTGESRFLPWLTGVDIRSVTHQGRIQAGVETVDADVVVELGDGRRIWIEAKTNQRPNSEEVRKDVAKMWRHFENARAATGIQAYVLATNEDSRSMMAWHRLRDDLDAHRAVGGGRKDLLNILGIDADEAASGPAEFLRMLHASVQDRADGSVSQRLASRLGDAAAAKPIAEALTTMLVDHGGRFDPVSMDHVLDVLRQRRLVHHPKIDARAAIQRVRAASMKLAEGLQSLHPEHPEWRIHRGTLLSDLDAAVSGSDVVLEGVSGSGKSTLLREWAKQTKPGEIILLTGDRYRATHKTWYEPWAGAGPSDLLEALVRDGVQVLAFDDIDDLVGESLQGLREVVRAARVTRGLRVLIAARPRSVASFVSAAERRYTAVKMPDLTDDEIRGADADHLDGQLSFLFEPTAAGLRRLACRPFALSLLVRLRIAGVEPAAFTDTDRVPTEEELVVRVWNQVLMGSAGGDAGDESTALKIAAALLASPTVGAGQIDRALRRLRDVGMIGRDDEELTFTHRGFGELATALAISRSFASGVSLLPWLNENANPLVRLGVVRSLVANDLHGPDLDHGKIRRRLAKLFADEASLALRLDAAEAVARNTTFATAEAIMDAFVAVGVSACAETLECFLSVGSLRIREGSLEAQKNTTILRRATELLHQADQAQKERLADPLLRFAETLATHTPIERIDEIRTAVMTLIEALDVWSAKAGERARYHTRLRAIRAVSHVLQDDAAAIESWASDSLDDPAFAEAILAELCDRPPTDPLHTLSIWERASATLRACAASPYHAEQVLPPLLEACPGPATASAIRLLTLHLPGGAGDEVDRCAEDCSAILAGPFTRSLDVWSFPAILLARAWRRWASRECGSKPELDKLEASIEYLQRNATTVLPRALLLETVAYVSGDELIGSSALMKAAWTVLREPMWVAQPSMISAAGKALSALASVDPATGVSVASTLLAAAREPEQGWGEGVIHALSELSEHSIVEVREIGVRAACLGGRTIEPTRLSVGFGRPDETQIIQHLDDSRRIDKNTDAYHATLSTRVALMNARQEGEAEARRVRAALTESLRLASGERDRGLRLAIERALAAECEWIAAHWSEAEDVDKAWALEQLPALSCSEDPDEAPSSLSDLAAVSSDARAACARALAALDVSGDLDCLLPGQGFACAERLLADPNPQVCVDAARALARYEKRHVEWMWREAGAMAAREFGVHAAQLLFWLAYALRHAARRSPMKGRDVLKTLLDRTSPKFTDASWIELRREIVQQLAVVAIENGGVLWDDLVEIAGSAAPDDLDAIAEIAVPWYQAEDPKVRKRAREVVEHALRVSMPGTRSAVHAVALEIARGAKLEPSTWELLGDVLSRHALDRQTLDVVIMAAQHTAKESPSRSMEFVEALCAKSHEDLGFERRWDMPRFASRTAALLLSLAQTNDDLRQRAAGCADLLRSFDPTEAGQLLAALRNVE